ncbi:MAG TPA: polyphenol oxidase family protein, partial [Streptosporangiaceae bacterium]
MIAPPTASSVFRRVRGLDVLTWPVFDAFPLRAVVTTRAGGRSAGAYGTLNLSFMVGDDPDDVLANRRAVAAALDSDLADFVFAAQVHGDVAQVVGAADRGRGTLTAADAVPGADVLVTADPGTVLAVLAADCVPIVLYDPVAHVLACAHSGWRGTVARTAAAAVRAMQSLGSRPADVIAGVGPAVAAARYLIDATVAGAAAAAFGDQSTTVLQAAGAGQWRFDLWAANRLVLRDAGVPGPNIHITGVPTGDGQFFSHRAEQP